jgi:hypothetical protein
MKLVKIAKKLYYLFLSRFIDGKIKIYNRHKNYEDYINKQLEKTSDPNRIKKWKGDEWQIKVDGFKNLFKRNEEFLKKKQNSICLGARTGARSICFKRIRFE